MIPSLAAVHGGPSRAMGLFARALAAAGVEMQVATTDDDGPGRRLGLGAAQYFESVPCRWFAKRSEFYKFSPGLAVWLARHVSDYDLVHIHAMFSFSSIAASVAALHADVPYILRPLGTLTHYGMQQRRPWLKRASLRWLDGPVLRRAAAVQFTADAEREQAAALGIPMRGVVVPLAVDAMTEPDDDEFLARFPALRDVNYILFLSRLDPKKNVESLLAAFATVAASHDAIKLVVAGDGEPGYVTKLKARAAALGLGSRVVWAGFLEGGLKAAALKGASVFVLPSFSENFGIAAAEALLAGLPCVLGRGVAIAADVERAGAGLAVEPDAGAIARALQHYLKDAAARAVAGSAASRFARGQYSVEAMGRNLLDLYTGILRQRATLAAVGQP